MFPEAANRAAATKPCRCAEGLCAPTVGLKLEGLEEGGIFFFVSLCLCGEQFCAFVVKFPLDTPSVAIYLRPIRGNPAVQMPEIGFGLNVVF